jgi:hypothetical protein
MSYDIHVLNTELGTQYSIFSASWFWLAPGIAFFLLLVVFVEHILRERRPVGRLTRAATALRRRISYTAALTLRTEIDVSGAESGIADALKMTDRWSPTERPTAVASLVFEFRNLAELIVATTKKPLVIGIDELDKISDPDAVPSLLQDVKGIFEITDVYYLVSVSE